MSIDELIAVLENAECGSRGLDGRIAYVLGWRFNGFGEHNDGIHAIDDPDFNEWDKFGGSWHKPGDRFIQSDERWDAAACERWADPKKYTTSVDAALRLMDEVLLKNDGFLIGPFYAKVITVDSPLVGFESYYAKTPAISLCVAILKAYKEQTNAKQKS